MIHTDKWTLWLRWLAANAFGELLGLGITFAAIALVLSRLENQQSVGVVLLSFLLSVASGACEATLVGLAQWWAMHPWFPMITRRCLVAGYSGWGADRLHPGLSTFYTDEPGRTDSPSSNG